MRIATFMMVAVLTATAVSAQEALIYGHLDTVRAGDTMSQQDLTFEGWALDCRAGQQPSHLDVYVATPAADGSWTLTRLTAGVEVVWRRHRPDVGQVFRTWCGLGVHDLWGYRVKLPAIVPEGQAHVSLMFTSQVAAGAHVQQVTINVVP